MFHPSLEVARRRLDDDRRREAGADHLGDTAGAQIVNQAEVVLASRANVDVSSVAVFVTKPSD